MSEFNKLIDLIGACVKFVLETTLNLLGAIFLTAAYIFPWRWNEIKITYFDDSDFVVGALGEFLITLFDCIFVPCGILSAASPFKWYPCLLIMDEYDRDEVMEIRLKFFANFIGAMFDLMTFPFFLLSIISPFRFYVICKSSYVLLKTVYNNIDHDKFRHIRKMGYVLNKQWLKYGVFSFLDAVTLIPGGVACFICPTLWSSYYRAMTHVRANRGSFLSRQPGISLYGFRDVVKEHFRHWDNVFFDYNIISVAQIPFALMDVLSLVLGLAALVSPLRCRAFLSSIKACFEAPCNQDVAERHENEVISHADNSTGGNLVVVSDRVRIENLQNLISQLRIELETYIGHFDERIAKVQELSLLEEELKELVSRQAIIVDANDLRLDDLNGYLSHNMTPQPGNWNDASHPVYEPPSGPLFYDFYLRRQCLYFGATSLIDVLLLPILVPLVVTWYRIAPFKNRLFRVRNEETLSDPSEVTLSEPTTVIDDLEIEKAEQPANPPNLDSKTKSDVASLTTARANSHLPGEHVERASPASHTNLLWGTAEYVLVFKLFCLLICDVINIPCLLLLYVTRIRVEPVLLIIQRGSFLKSGKASLHLYGILLRQLILLVCDALVSPLVLCIVSFGFYRAGVIIKFWQNRDLWHVDNLFGIWEDVYSVRHYRGTLLFHLSVFITFCVVLFDYCILVPMSLLLLCSGYRTMATIDILQDAIKMWQLRDESVEVESDSNPTPSSNPTAEESAACERRDDASELNMNGGVNSASPRISEVWLTWNSIFANGNTNQMQMHCRKRILLECWELIVDIPFICMMLFVFATLWRCALLASILRLLQTHHNWYINMDSSVSNPIAHSVRVESKARNRSLLNKYRRKAILLQFGCLLRDIVCLIPFALVIATVYRLPSVLIQIVVKIKMQIRALLFSKSDGSFCGESVEKPLYIVSASKMLYPELGGPTIYFDVTPNPEYDTGCYGGIAVKPKAMFHVIPGTASCVDTDRNIDFWAEAASIFGATLVTVAKSMLPLELEGDAIDISELLTPSLDVAEVRQKSGVEKTTCKVAMKLDLGTTKRSTVVKKLLKLISSCGNVRLFFQIDVNIDAVDDNGVRHIVRRPLLVFAPTTEELYTMILCVHSHAQRQIKNPAYSASSANEGIVDPELLYFPLDNETIQLSSDCVGTMPVDELHIMHNKNISTSEINDTDNPCLFSNGDVYTMKTLLRRKVDKSIETDGLVNTFWIIVCKACLDLFIDMVHVAAVLVTLMTPWRFGAMVHCLLEPCNRWSWRVATKSSNMLRHTDSYMLRYRAGFNVMCNKFAKIITVQGSNYHTYWNVPIANRLVNKITAIYNDCGGYTDDENPLDDFTEMSSNSDSPYQYASIEQMEKQTLSPYRKIFRKLISTLESNSPTVPSESMDTYQNMIQRVKERQILQDQLLQIWTFRVLVNAEFIYAEGHQENIASSMRSASNISGIRYQYYNNLHYLGPQARATVLSLLWQQNASIVKTLSQNKKVIGDLVDKLEEQMQRADVAFKEELLEKARTKQWSCSKRVLKYMQYNVGVLKRPLKQSQQIIRIFVLQALTDIGFVVLFLFMCMTLVRVLPMLQELHAAKAYDLTRFTSRSIIVKHARGFVIDLKEYGLFVTYSLLICVLVVGLPSYLSGLMSHMHSMRTLNRYAKENLSRSLEYFCEFLALFGVWRTYKIVVTASLYCLLVPGACIAETLSIASGIFTGRSVNASNNDNKSSTTIKFYCGLILYYALFIGACVATNELFTQMENSYSNDVHTENVDMYASAFMIQVIVCGAVGAYLITSTVIYLASNKSNLYWSPAPTLSPSNFLLSNASWSQFLGLLTPLCEVVYLCAVVLYFFWDNTNIVGSSNSEPVLTSSVGCNSLFITKILCWNSGSFEYEVSMIVGVCVSFMSGMLIAIPLAISNGSNSHSTSSNWRYGRNMNSNIIRWLKLVDSSLFDTCNVLFSRIFSIWIVATLLRPSGCDVSDTTVHNSSGMEIPLSFLSTSETVLCGGIDSSQYEISSDSNIIYDDSLSENSRLINTNWTSLLALPLLVYLLITTTILHADSENFRSHVTNGSDATGVQSIPLHEHVKFAPLYVMLHRVLQYCIVAVSFIGFTSMDTTFPLGIVGMCAWIGMCWCIYWQKSGCTMVSVPPFRTAGYICVLWTVALCVLRNYDPISSEEFHSSGPTTSSLDTAFVNERVLYMGYAVIYLVVGGGFAWMYQKTESARWSQLLMASGLAESMRELLSISKMLVVDNTIGASTTNAITNCSSSNNTIRSSNMNFAQQVLNNALDDLMKYLRVTDPHQYIGSANDNVPTGYAFTTSIPRLIRSILIVEDLILVEKLTLPFLKERVKWRRGLKGIYALTNGVIDDDNEYGTNHLSELEDEETRHQHSDIEAPSAGNGAISNTTQSNDMNPSVATNAHPHSLLYALGRIRMHVSILKRHIVPTNLKTDIGHVLVTREVLDRLLYFKLPQDLVWLIYSYCYDTSAIRSAMGVVMQHFSCRGGNRTENDTLVLAQSASTDHQYEIKRNMVEHFRLSLQLLGKMKEEFGALKEVTP